MNILVRGSIAQRSRLVAGIILFCFVSTHFINHGLGLWSIELMEIVQSYRLEITRSRPGEIILLTAFLTHIFLALWKLARRKTLKMPLWEGMQLVLGFSIPVLILPHMFDQRVSSALQGQETRYQDVLSFLWPNAPILHSIALLVVWIHCCIGLHFWLRLWSGYRKAFLPLFALAVIIPLWGLAGFMVAGREAAEISRIAKNTDSNSNIPNSSDYNYGDYSDTPENQKRASGSEYDYGYEESYADENGSVTTSDIDRDWWKDFLLILFYSLLLIALIYPRAKKLFVRRLDKIPVSYVAGPSLLTNSGPTLLEISRMNDIPHMSVCGGRARCSTCRVRIISGINQFSPPSKTEAATLFGINAPSDVRLACQIRPSAPLSVIRIVPPRISTRNTLETIGEEDARGVEQDMVVMFIDVRGFTRMSADKLPYDVVFILNQFFDAAGEAIERENGWIDKYLGDGLMAVFGRKDGSQMGCRQALRAAVEIDLALDRVNEAISSEIIDPLQIGIGIHAGSLVLGKIGYRNSSAITVIGRTVNTAARLEAMTKEKKCQVIVSSTAAELAGLDSSEFKKETVTVRGLDDPIEILIVPKGRDIRI